MSARVHHLAPAIVEDAVSPFATQGTRLTWSSGEQWASHAVALMARRCSAKAYQDQAAHLDELARHTDFIAAQPIEDLRLMSAAVAKYYQPPRGQRRGTSFERITVEINNAIARHALTEGRQAVYA